MIRPMDTAISKVEFNEVEGEKSTPGLTVYALSTCAFCRRAMGYLRENGFGYRFVYLDQLDFDLKREVKAELKERYGDIKLYPILTINDADMIAGFKQERWAEALGLPAETTGE